MCGIAGAIHYQDIDLNHLVQSLRHRGPDQETIYTDYPVALIHTRLAIQDIEQGAQPIHYGNYSIIFNGEIYNHQTLRQYLKEFNFKTQSDTETLLYLFIKYGTALFDKIDGMFAFCIYDKTKNQLFLARDRSGKKPLYYHASNHDFIFASELNTLKQVKKLEINDEAINCYLRAGYIWKPYTPYQQVFEVPAGSYVELNVDTLQYQVHSFFNLLNEYHTVKNDRFSFNDYVATLETHLKQSIHDRLMASDVEVGVFLSGGIDSNLIAALAAQMKPNLKTFTVKFAGLYDESNLARLTAKKYQTNHIELNVSSNLKEDIEKILLCYGEPFMDSSAIPSYYVSQKASEHVKVVLSGDGADELFAGYRRYVPAAYGLNQYIKPFASLLKILPKPQVKQSLYNYIYRLLTISQKQGLDYYLSATTDVFEDIHSFPEGNILQELKNFVHTISIDNRLSRLHKALYADFSTLLFCDLLVKMDIASMAHSLEVRSPFLSKSIVEFAAKLPGQYKIKQFKTKYILRKLAENHLPPELVNQPKRGFEVPLRKWINEELKESIFDRLTLGCYAENYVDRKFIRQLLEDKLDVGPEKRAKMIWSLYCLEVWHQNETKNRLYC